MDRTNRNDYTWLENEEEFAVYSSVTERFYFGSTLSIAQANRDAAEQAYYRHHKYDLYPVED